MQLSELNGAFKKLDECCIVSELTMLPVLNEVPRKVLTESE